MRYTPRTALFLLKVHVAALPVFLTASWTFMHSGSSALRTRKSPSLWFVAIAAFASLYSSIELYLSMWSGVMLRIAAPLGLNSSMASS